MREYLKERVIPKFIDTVKGIDETEVEQNVIAAYLNEPPKESSNLVREMLEKLDVELDVETLTYLFEALLEKEYVSENGIVFTPQYIATYICKGVLDHVEKWDEHIKIIDPGCGCGIFLIAAILYIHDRFDVPVSFIIKNNIYGIDITEKNVRRCKMILQALAKINHCIVEESDIHIVCKDALKLDWCETFRVQRFDYIIGNPPYVNTHDMSKETVDFLKNHFITTKTGVYNIFYAFIEHAMKFLSAEGKLSYIVPNNFLTIKSAAGLREYLQKNTYIKSILDFGDNMVFKPIRTYNCIIILDKCFNNELKYHVMEKAEDIREMIERIRFDYMPVERLDKNGWKLVDNLTYTNLIKIESQFKPIKDFVRTGIATLRDNVFMVDKCEDGYCKTVNGKKYVIEKDIVKTVYKIPELKKCKDIHEVSRYIIFPYVKGKQGFEIIEECKFKELFPGAYGYLADSKDILSERDKGKPNSVAWYAYGRTQGLNRYGRKILFPTFSNKPKFMLVEDEMALFCNGYGVFENGYLELDELLPVLNSRVMHYYVSNTSYSIEGGYYCYQKKYIEKFSIPRFSENEKKILRCGSKEEIDQLLIDKYELII